MKSPSELGLAIEAAVAANPKPKKYREPVQYLCFFRTSTGRAFACERVTISKITLWLPDDERVRAAADASGAPITKSVPFPNERNTYGRISSLRSEADDAEQGERASELPDHAPPPAPNAEAA